MASITRFYALVLSTVLLLSGVPGFFPTVGQFQAMVAFFALTLVHAVVHAAVGLLGLMITALASDEAVRIYTLGIALLYGILAVVGLAGFDFSPVLYFNSADNWLHGSIFALSLGVVLVGIAEDRMRRRTARIADSLPAAHWKVPSAPAYNTASASSRPITPTPAYGTMAGSDQASWYNPSLNDQQPSSQPRDPWTREQRRSIAQRPASTPSEGQHPESPWSPYPSLQSPWPQSQPPRSQPREQWPLDEWPSLRDSRPTQ